MQCILIKPEVASVHAMKTYRGVEI